MKTLLHYLGLITELLYRLQPFDDKTALGYFCGLLIQRDGKDISLLQKKLLYINASKQGFLLPCKIDTNCKLTKDSKSLCLKTLNTLYKKRAKLNSSGRSETRFIPLHKKSYEEPPNVSELIQKTLTLFAGKNMDEVFTDILSDEAKNPVNNVFYLADISSNKYYGGVNLQILYDKKLLTIAKDKDVIDELKGFLADIQWICSHYVIQLVVDVESAHPKHQSAYCEEYFGDEKSIESLNKSLSEIPDILSGLGMKDENENTTFKNVIDCLIHHFQMSIHPVGREWVGYERQAYEVAYAVAGVADSLFYPKLTENDPRKTLKELIRMAGIGLEELMDLFDSSDNSSNHPFFIRQLFTGMIAEKDLLEIPRYREHFIHSFHVFVIGLLLMTNKISLTGKLEFGNIPINKDFLKKWFLTAMWHDIGYSIEKISELSERHVRRLWSEKNIPISKNLFKLHPSPGHLFQMSQTSKTFQAINNNLSNYICLCNDKALIPILKNEQEYIYHNISYVLMNQMDHGIWSSIIFGHAMEVKKPDSSDKDKYFEEDSINQIIGAILVHHLPTWKNLEDIRMKNTEGEYSNDNGKSVAESYEINIPYITNPLGALLLLSDTLSQGGREVYNTNNPDQSNLGIRFETIKAFESFNKLYFAISQVNFEEFDKTKYHTAIEPTIERFYDIPINKINGFIHEDTTSGKNSNANMNDIHNFKPASNGITIRLFKKNESSEDKIQSKLLTIPIDKDDTTCSTSK